MARMTMVVAVVVVIAFGGFAAYFISGGTGTPTSTTSTSSTTCCSTNVLRIGYFANINHGQALVGLFNGDFQKALGSSVQIQLSLFTAGPTEMTALLAGKLDMA